MSANHGSTPAAWTAVVIVIAGFVVGAFGTVFMEPVWIAAGGGIVVVGGIAGKTMQLMGLGKRPHPVPVEQAAQD